MGSSSRSGFMMVKVHGGLKMELRYVYINFQFGSKLFYIYLNSVLYALIWSNVHDATLSNYELDFTIMPLSVSN